MSPICLLSRGQDSAVGSWIQWTISHEAFHPLGRTTPRSVSGGAEAFGKTSVDTKTRKIQLVNTRPACVCTLPGQRGSDTQLESLTSPSEAKKTQLMVLRAIDLVRRWH